MASLLDIPLELLVSISSYLSTADLAALRLTCKQTEKSLYEWFSQEFFTKKQFMLTHSSLQTFVDISRHVSFSKKLTHVIIATNIFDEIPLRFRDKEAASRYIQGYEDQKALLSTGVDREMLSEAFSNLVNLNTVGIRDFNAESRVRDGAHASWTSWGATTVYRETGVELQFSGRGSHTAEVGARFVSRVFTSVIYALGKANRHPPEFEVLLRRSGLPDTGFALPEFLVPTVKPLLESLTTLLLNVDLGNRYLHTHDNGTPTDANAGRALRRFLGCAPNLTHLRLNFQKYVVENNAMFLDWLSAPVSTLPSSTSAQSTDFLEPAPIALPHLRQLDLGQLNARSNTLIAVITKFAPTLKELNLWRMDLHSMAPPPFGHKPNHWADLFIALGRISQLKLDRFKAGMLQQDHMLVNFTATGSNDETPLKVVEHTGKDIDKFLKDITEHVFVQWPEPLPDHEDDSDEDEVMADEDDEDEEEEDEEDDNDEDDDYEE